MHLNSERQRERGRQKDWSPLKDRENQFSQSVVSDSLRPHEPQHARPPCPSATPGVHPNPCPLSWSCHLTISSSVVPFFSCSQSFPALGSFPMSQFFASGGHNIALPTNNGVLILSCFLPRISIMAKLIFLSFWYLTDRYAEYHLPS